MPAKRPAASGYARIAQAEEEEEEGEEEEEEEEAYNSDTEDPFTDSAATAVFSSSPASGAPPRYAPIQPQGSMRMPGGNGALRSKHTTGRSRRANSGVDIKAINARLERWADEIKDRFTRRKVKGKSAEEEHLEIHHSVFHAPDWVRPATKEMLEHDASNHGEKLSKLEFDDMVESVRTAIELGLHPKLIAQGSSGSYFARNSGGKTVGVFKPKDEEPYASKNPKWTKWIHRNLFPFAFGRAMLIPNLSYVSEAAAYVLDCQLRTNLVPYTDVVGLSSKSFHYDWMDRRAYYRKGRPFPEKLGSFQVFLTGFKGATEFFQEHPWPDLNNASFRGAPARKKRTQRWDASCRPSSRTNSRPTTATTDSYNTDDEDDDAANAGQPTEFWTTELQQSFREELEKLVILDYVMRNTDRGSDNWMIRIDRDTNTATIVKEPPKTDGAVEQDGYNRRNENMNTSPPSGNGRESAVPRIGAIDNSLSWPWKHPDAWRSYPFGWLFLPVGLIGRPFSEKTRRHFLPLLTSKDWWSETQVKLRNCFEIDVDFQERMFARQMAVMKGQAWNVVETLKTPDHGPLELTRRSRVHVWDDLVDIPVAVPLARASEEMRMRAAAVNAEEHKRRALAAGTPAIDIAEDEEEMDISAAHPSASALNIALLDHLGTSLPAKMESTIQTTSNRFNMSRENSSQNVNGAQRQSSATAAKEVSPPSLFTSPSETRSVPRPANPFRSRTGEHRHRVSLDVPRTQWLSSPNTSRYSRRFSASLGSGRHNDSEDDGDLGYAATSEREGATRRVIVERLEMVKSRKPLFEWC